VRPLQCRGFEGFFRKERLLSHLDLLKWEQTSLEAGAFVPADCDISVNRVLLYSVLCGRCYEVVPKK
jgi:hypothetical protein